MRAIDIYESALRKHLFDPALQTGIARVHDMLNDARRAFTLFRSVLNFDNNSVEAIASIASYHFYTD